MRTMHIVRIRNSRIQRLHNKTSSYNAQIITQRSITLLDYDVRDVHIIINLNCNQSAKAKHSNPHSHLDL
jgi:hypothetical protein